MSYKIAQAQYNQALSANYPTIDYNLVVSRRDENKNNKTSNEIELSSDITKNLAFSGALLQTGDISTAQSVAGATSGSSTLTFDSDNDVIGRDTVVNLLNLIYPIYTGGKISSIINQAKLNENITRQDIKLKDEEIIYNVKKVYYGYLLLSNIYNVAYESLEKMSLVQNLSKTLYESESLNVKKTDYLKSKFAVDFIKAEVEKIKYNRDLTMDAFKNLLSVPYNVDISIKEKDFDYAKILNKYDNFDSLFDEAKDNNTILNKMDIAINISKEQIKESKSVNYPTIALFSQASNVYNSLNNGFDTNENKNSWNIGIRAKMNLFDGFKSKNQIEENFLKKKRLENRMDFVKDGIALQIKKIIRENRKSFNNIKNYKNANLTAIENRDLNIKAYQIDMVETKDVLESQVYQAKAEIFYYNAVHDYFLSIAKLNKIIGK